MTDQPQPRPQPRWALIVAILLAFSVFSVVYQGFDYGVVNNASHATFIHRHENPEMYPGNEFIDALKNYCSWVWYIIPRLSFFSDWAFAFLVFHILARWVILLGLFGILRSLIPPEGRWLGVAAFLGIPVSNALYLHSPVAISDMFMWYFNQTEVALGLIFVAYALVWHRRDLAGFIVAGLAFNVNVFFGIWAAIVMGIYVLWRDRRFSIAQQVRTKWRPFLAYILVGLPTTIWVLRILANKPEFVPYDYADFLMIFWPFHYFIWVSPPAEILKLLMAVATGIFSLLLLRRGRERAGMTIGVHYAMFIVGMLMPLLSTSKIAMDIQFMRNESFFTILAVVFAAAVAIQRLVDPNVTPEIKGLGLVVFLSLIFGFWPMAVCGLVLIIAHERTLGRASLPVTAFTIILLAIGLFTMGHAPITANIYNHPQLARLCLLAALGAAAIIYRCSFAALAAGVMIMNYSPFGFTSGGVLLSLFWLAPDQEKGRWSRSIALILLTGLCIKCALDERSWLQFLSNPYTSHPPHFLLSDVQLEVEGEGVVASRLRLLILAAIAALACAIGLYRILDWKPLRNLKPATLLTRPAVAFTLALALLVLPIGASITRHRIHNGDITNTTQLQREYRELGLWIDDNLPIDAQFLIFLNLLEFPAYAKRNYFYNNKLGDGVVTNPALYYEYKRRREAKARFYDPAQAQFNDPIRGYENELIEFAHAEGISHVIVWRQLADDAQRLNLIRETPMIRLFEVPPAQ